jgi:hypothetical protein
MGQVAAWLGAAKTKLHGASRCMARAGPPKKSRWPPWWEGMSEAKKGLGSDLFFFRYFFYRVFELPSPSNAQKRDKKKFEKKSVLDFWPNFL